MPRRRQHGRAASQALAERRGDDAVPQGPTPTEETLTVDALLRVAERGALLGGLALMAWGIAHLLCPTAFELVNGWPSKPHSRPHAYQREHRSRPRLGAAQCSYSSSHRGRHSCLTYLNASLLCRQRLLRN